MVNFPAEFSSFVGRQDELAQIAALLSNPACRLLTLVGPGGIGKTRLAVEAARRFPSAYFIALQPLASADFMVSAMADSIAFQFYSGSDPKQQLLDYLHDKPWLLVLDNFEHLLDGAALVSEILTSAPGVQVLVTSRERLNLIEEWVLEIGGLAYPSGEIDADADHYSAIELFIQHAQRVKAGFALTAAQRQAAVRICRLVGGMPLGIELAASWVRALSCDAIADEIECSLDILESPARNVEPRHRTMRAAFEPTWERLTDHERDVFMKLSVFRGGFTREAAEAVAGTSLRTLSALVDKSLLRIDSRGRYDLHELLRQFAWDKLTAEEASAVADRHLDYCLMLAEQVEANNWGREQVVWFDRIEIEFDNLRAALAWSLSGGHAEKGLQLAGDLCWFFSERMNDNEGYMWLEQTLAASPNAPVFLRAKALVSAGRLNYDPPRRRAYFDQALALAHATNDRWNAAWALSHQGLGEVIEGLDQAAATLDESLRLFRELEDPMGLSHTLVRRSWLTMKHEDYPASRALLEEAWNMAREDGDKIIMGWARFGLGQISHVYDHDPQQARIDYENGVSYFREARYTMGALLAMNLLAKIEVLLGHAVRAQTLLREVMTQWGVAFRDAAPNNPALVGLATVARFQGQFERAARLLASVDKDELAGFYVMSSEFVAFFEDEVALVHAQLSEDAFAEAWAAGKAMTREQVIAYALEGSSASGEPADSRQQTTPPIALTARELEVLRLMADGFSNGEIAEQIVLAKSTVKWYINGIFSKLDATSRTQAVARARTLGLLI